MKSQRYRISSHLQSRSETFPMSPAWCSRAVGRCQRDAATWPAPATEGAGGRPGPAPALSPGGLRRAMHPGYARGRHQWGAPSLFPAGRIFPGAEGILSVRLSETRDSGARASGVGPNVTPARCSLLTRLVPRLKAGGWAMRTPAGRGLVSAAAGITANDFRS